MVADWVFYAVLALSAGVSYVQTKKAQKEAKKIADAMAGVLITQDSSIESIPVIYGERRVGGHRVFIESSVDEKHKTLYMAIVLSEGEVEDIDVASIRIDDKPINQFPALYGDVGAKVFDPALGVWAYQIGTGNNVKLKIEAWRGKPDQPASSVLTPAFSWTANHKLSGLAYLAIRMDWNAEAFTGVPDINVVVKGKKVYDPRTGTTAYSDNAALCMLDYMKSNIYGKGIPDTAFDEAAFIAAANDIDSFTITPYIGGPAGQQLFKLNGVIDTKEEIFRNIERLLLACRGFLPYSNGQYSLKIDQASTPVMTINEDMIIGGIGINGGDKKDRFNIIEVKFPNKKLDYQPDSAIWPDPQSGNMTSFGITEAQLYAQFVAEDNGYELRDEVDLDYTTDYYAARDMARILCLRSRDALAVSIECTTDVIDLVVGDVVNIEHPTPGWSTGAGKPFQVDSVSMSEGGTVKLSLIEYTSSIYAYDPANEEREYPDTNLPDPFSVDAPASISASSASALLGDGTLLPRMSVTWGAVADAFVTEYEIRYKLAAANTYEYTRSRGTTALIEGINVGVYDVGVRAINSIGAKSAWIDIAEANRPSVANDTTVPNDITSLTATAGPRQVTLSWTNPSDVDYKQTRIYQNTADSVPTTHSYVVTGDTLVVTGLDPDTNYYFWAENEDYAGNIALTKAASGVVTPYKINLANENNSSGWVDATGAAAAAPVQSVNNATGNVVIATRGLALLLNKTANGTANTGECGLVGIKNDGSPNLGTNGWIVYDGQKITVPKDNGVAANISILTNLANKTGFIAFDTQGTKPFASNDPVGLGSFDTAFVFKDSDGKWKYDNNGAAIEFDPLAAGTKILALGWLKTGGADTIIDGALFAEPSPLTMTPFAGSELNQYAYLRYTRTDNTNAPTSAQFLSTYGREPRKGDIVVVTNTATTPDTQAAYEYSGTAFVAVTNFISGDLIVDGSITADQINANSVASAVITAGSIVVTDDLTDGTTAISGDNISTGTISANRISVQGKHDVNPVFETRNVNRWGGIDTDGNVVNATPAGIVFEWDATEGAMELRCDGNVGMRSDSFTIDHNAIYKVSLKIRKGAAIGTWYLGAWQSTSDFEQGIISDGGNVQTSIDFTYWTTARAQATSANVYFAGGSTVVNTGYETYTFYLLGANRTVNECPQYRGGFNVSTPYIRFDASARCGGLRILNWSNGTTVTSLFINQVSVQKVGSGTIVADNIEVTNLSSINSDLGAITAGSLNINDAFTVSSTGDVVASSAIINGEVTASKLNAVDAVIEGDLIAKNVTAGSITVESIRQEVWNEIDSRFIAISGAAGGFYDKQEGLFSGANLTLTTVAVDHESKDITLQLTATKHWASAIYKDGNDLKVNIIYEYSTNGTTWTQVTDGTNNASWTYTASRYAWNYGGYTSYTYYLNSSGTLFTIPAAQLAIGTYYFRARIEPVNATTNAFTLASPAISATFEANEAAAGVTATGGNADTVDNLHASSFMRSDANTSTTGDITIARGTTSKQTVHDLYIGGSGLDGADSAIYIGNNGAGGGYGWEFYYQGSGSGNDNKLIIRSENLGTSVDALSFTQDGSATFGKDLIVSGNLTISGTTTTLNTATLDVEDKNITLNYGAGDTSASADGAGITIQDAVDANTDASLTWDATNDRWVFSHRINGVLEESASIPNAIDLNNYRTTGIYCQISNSQAAAGSNYPVDLAGILVVYHGAANGLHTQQTYYRYNANEVYTRYYYNGTWSSWGRLARKDELDTKLSLSGGTLTGSLSIDSGTAGDAKLTLRADTDNNDEGDHPSIHFLQDGDLVGFRIGIGATDADSTSDLANELVISSTTSNYGLKWSPDNGTTGYDIIHAGHSSYNNSNWNAAYDRVNYQNLGVDGDHDMHVWNKVLAHHSDNSGTSTYLVIKTNVPQDNFSMGGFSLTFVNDYSGSATEGDTVDIYGYWNPESNGGFIGFRYSTCNPDFNPTIQVARDTDGKTVFIISGENTNYAQLIAKNLWFGYTSTGAAASWGDDWDILQTNDIAAYVNNNTLNRIGVSRAQMNDWDTAYTYSQVGHLPLTGGSLSGFLTLSANSGMYQYTENGAYINWDTRDATNGGAASARVHKWARKADDSGHAPYYENWYDGNSYHEIGVEGDRFKFGGGIDAAGLITAEDGIRIGTGSGAGNSANTAAIDFGEGTPTGQSMFIEYDGEGASGDANYIGIGSYKTGVGTVIKAEYGGNFHVLKNSYFTSTATFSNNSTAIVMDGGASAQGIQMQADNSTTYPVFLRSINPASGESSPWLYKEANTAWGIWHNNPSNTIDFTRGATTGNRIADDVGGGDNSVTIRLDMANGYVQAAGGFQVNTTTVIDSARNLTNMAAGSFSSYVSADEFISNSIRLQDGYREIALGTFNFGNDDPNNFIDIIFTCANYWGMVEVEITSSYSWQNACGSLIKRFAVGHNSSSSGYGGGSEEVISDTGYLSDSIRIGSVTRSGTDFIIPVNKYTTTNNSFEVRVKLFSLGYSASTTVTLGSKYAGTNLAREYTPFKNLTGKASSTSFSGNIEIGDTLVIDSARNISNIGSINASSIDASGELEGAYIGVSNSTSNNGYGISLYGGGIAGEPTYGIMFQGTPTFGTHGGVTGTWATYFTMNNDNTRGWIFRKAGTGNVASIDGAGDATFDGTLTTGSTIYANGGSANWGTTTQGTGRATIHLDPNSATDHFGCGITFGASDSGDGATAQAGIYTRSDGTYGTKMYISTTDAYVSGSKTAITIEHTGQVTINRSSLTAAGDITAFSDAKLKDNVKTVEGALDKVLALRGVTYTRNDQSDKDRIHLGVIAQEVEKVLPEVVTHNEEADVKTVSYGNMVAVLIEAIKEQQSEIDELKLLVKQLLEK